MCLYHNVPEKQPKRRIFEQFLQVPSFKFKFLSLFAHISETPIEQHNIVN